MQMVVYQYAFSESFFYEAVDHGIKDLLEEFSGGKPVMVSR